MNVVELPAMPILDRNDWDEIAAGLQYAADRVWPHDPRRGVWLRLRNVALESAWIGEVRREAGDQDFQLTGGVCCARPTCRLTTS